jgi:hypothetical protein
MLNILSLLIGAVALLLGIFAFLPLLGWAYWVIVPMARSASASASFPGRRAAATSISW